jgi:preprotein translocase subunit SecA
MIFDWLRQWLSAVKPTTKVWVDDAAKWRGVCDEIAAAHAQGATVVVIAHFHSTSTALEAALRDRSIAFAPSSSLELSSFNQSLAGAAVLVVQSQNIRPRLANASRSDVARIVFVVVERYPTPERDETLLKTVASLGSSCEVVYHLALSDPLLKEFNTEKIQTLLQRLGLSQDESLQSSIITKAIRNAQNQIAQKVPREVSASSPEEWFKTNLPRGYR